MTKETAIRLGDLCDLISEPVRPGARPDALYLGLEHLASGRLTRIGGGSAAAVRSNASAFQAGDVLYGKLRPYLDKAVLADCDGVCTTELLVLRPRDDVDAHYLAAVLHTPDFLEHAIAGTTGVQHPRTSWAHMRELGVSAYSLAEQSEIANLLWQAHEAITRCEALLAGTQSLKRAAMRTLFTRGLRGEAQKETEIGPLPESWGVARVGDTVTPLRIDRLIQVPTREYAAKGKWPIIDQGQAEVAGYTDEAPRVLDLDAPVIVFGDHTRVFKFVDYPFALGADGTKPLQATSEFNPKYLYHALCHLDVPARGYNRHYTVLAEMAVPRPSLAEQAEIADILHAIDRKADLHRRKRAALEELFKALLRGLMTGKVRVAKVSSREVYRS